MKLFKCQHCGQLLYFENDLCLKCSHRLGFIPEIMNLSALEPEGDPQHGVWHALAIDNKVYRFCANAQYEVCNWLVPANSDGAYCQACELNRIIPDLTNQEINNLAVPPDIVNWMLRKKLPQEHPQPDSGFDKVWTTFLSRLAISDREKTSDILQEMWCRPVHTGIVFLLLGMHWQAEYFGTGKDWHRNVKRVEHIFNIIISHPSLYVFNLLIRYVS